MVRPARGDGRLAERDAAVVRRQPLGDQHAGQAPALQRRGGPLEQQPVLEDAAGEHDGLDPGAPRPRPRRRSPWRAARPLWKRAEISAAGVRRQVVRDDSRGLARASSTPAVDAAAGRRRARRASAARLELDRRLALVGDLRRADRRAPRRRRRGGPCWSSAGEASPAVGDLRHCAHRGSTARERARSAGVVRRPREPGAGHPPGLADRRARRPGIRTGHRCPARSKPRGRRRSSSPPQIVPSVP